MSLREEVACMICQEVFNENPYAQSFGASEGVLNWMERVHIADSILDNYDLVKKGHVKMPESVEEAAAMNLLSENYLKWNSAHDN